MDSRPFHIAPDTICADLRMILRAVLAALGMWRLDVARMVLVHRRISVIGHRIERLLQRYRAGRLWRVLLRVGTQSRGGGRRAMSIALPRRFGWLVQAGGHQAAGFGSQLQAVLNAPEMQALLAESSQARRMLRPLCRALAVQWPCMLATSAEAAGEAGKKPPRKCRGRAVPPPFHIPLPRGVVSAAKRQGFGKRG